MTNLTDFRHIFVIEDQKARRIVTLEEPTYSIGRESSNDIVIYDRVVSRYHATLIRIKPSPKNESYSYRILDGDLESKRSTNGLIINGQRIESHDLKHGDVIVFGSQSKASYYIVSTSLDIAIFSPIEGFAFDNSHQSLNEDDDDRSTLINEEEASVSPSQASVDLVRFSSFAELSPSPIIEIDFDGNIVYLNPTASIKFKEIYDQKLSHPILEGLLNQAQNAKGNLLLREIQIDEECYEQYVHYLTDYQVIRSYLIDISRRKHVEQSLAQHTFYDKLTGLPNRIFFEEQLAIALASARRDQTPLAILFLSFINYNRIVNTFGLKWGEVLIKTAAKRLTQSVGNDGLACHWLGNEFVCLIKKTKNDTTLRQTVDSLLNCLASKISVNGQDVHLKGQVGVAVYPAHGKVDITLLKNARTALEQAQTQKVSFLFYDEKLSYKTDLLFRLENLLYEALKKEQFYLAYQPIFRVKNRKITSLEALLRWYHPEIGEIFPNHLIPLAEKTDLILSIGNWIMSQACRQNKIWQDQGFPPLSIAINLSKKQFQNSNLVDDVKNILNETGLSAKWLAFDLTETIMMDNLEYSANTIRQLQALGITINLDDFGVGTGSLLCLQKLKIDTLKIHQSFIQNITTKPANKAIIKSVLKLGEDLGIRIIGKGIENQEQAELLESFNCQEMQGFWFGKPIKSNSTTKLFTINNFEKVG